MLYWLYWFSGNTPGTDEYVCYSEIDDEGYWNRYVEISSTGEALRYSRDYVADNRGVLPEGRWDEHEDSLKEFGTVISISAKLFDAVWVSTHCVNASV